MNSREYFEDIICAKATPSGSSAVAIIRVSGKDSWKILENIFKSNNLKSDNIQSHKVYYGNIVNKTVTIDSVLVLTFKNDSSFTGEESFEINCHGSEIITSLIINLLIENGVRLANPGEFSKRAFLNGKISLNQAESIMDIVHSSTERSALIAVRQLKGKLNNNINIIKEKTAQLLASIEVFIDYPEEDITLDLDKWKNDLIDIKDLSEILLKGYKRGKYFRSGVESVIIGKTNAGKSTLFNYLLNEDKAIVSDIHGTTRDYIDGIINIEGYGVRLYDTAGLRDTDDPIEKEGTRRSIELSMNADIILYIINAIDGLTTEDKENLNQIKPESKLLIIINKIDQNPDTSRIENEIKNIVIKNIKYKIVKMSALLENGLDDFNAKFVEILIDQKQDESDDPILTNERHAQLLEFSYKNIINCYDRIDETLLDLAAFELRESLDRLGELTGEITPEDILDRIFSTFCVGK